jgi:hypothetical protein
MGTAPADGSMLWTRLPGPEHPVLVGRLLVERWPAALQDVARRLLSARRVDHTEEFLSLERELQGWIADAFSHLERGARIYLIQDAGLRGLDLAALIPTAFAPPRLDLAVTPIFGDGFLPARIERALARPACRPSDVAILDAFQEEGSLDARKLAAALHIAERRGVTIGRSSDARQVREFLASAPAPGRTHVLIAHSPSDGVVSIGRTKVSWSYLNRGGEVSAGLVAPVELDVSVCGSSPFAAEMPNTYVSAASGHLWVADVANVHHELWTSTWRRRLGGDDYWTSGFCYGEALQQARALHRHFAVRGEDPMDEELMGV